MSRYSDEWSSSINGLSYGKVYGASGEPLATVAPIATIETDNYYYTFSNYRSGVTILEKKNGKTLSINDIPLVRSMRIQNTDAFYVLGDSVIVVHWSRIAQGPSDQTKDFFWWRFNPNGVINTAYHTVPSPYAEYSGTGRTQQESFNSYFEKNGDLIVRYGLAISHTGGKDNERVSIRSFNVTLSAAGGAFASEMATKEIYTPFGSLPNYVALATYTDSRGVGVQGIGSLDVGNPLYKPNFFLSNTVLTHKMDGDPNNQYTDVFIGPSNYRDTLRGNCYPENQTLLSDKPRDKEHQMVKGKFGIAARAGSAHYYTVDYKGSTDVMQIPSSVFDVDIVYEPAVAVDNENGVYIAARQYLAKIKDGALIWKREILPNRVVVVDHRFVEGQRYLLMVTTVRGTADSSNLYCVDTETGEVVWEYFYLAQRPLRAVSSQLPSQYLITAQAMVDLKLGDSEKLKPFILANINTIGVSERIHHELVAVDFNVRVRCDRIPADPKYLST